MGHQVAADGAQIVVAVKEAINGNNLRLSLARKFLL
jgi:hypothetical protein